jgi:hypothetical protein
LETGRDCSWIGLGPGGQLSEAQVAFVPPVSIKDRSLHWIPGQVTDILSRAYTCLGVGFRWRSKHHTEAGPAVLGAWSPSLDGDLDPLIGVKWVGLTCAWGASEACVFGAPS